jgi:8-oxo-dGTP pyrophosphatase MutT (NUDIX family)
VSEASCIYEVDRIICRRVDYAWPYERDNAAAIQRHWAMRRRETPSIYDGRVLLACRVETDEACSTLRMDMFETGFSAFLACRDAGWPDRSAFNCFSMPAVRSSDGGFLVGEMTADHSVAGALYFPCGTPDPSDLDAAGGVDLLGSLMRELGEETGLDASRGALRPRWTIVVDGQRIACIRTIDWPEDAASLVAETRRRIAAQSRPELANVHIFTGSSALSDPRLPPYMTSFLSRAFCRGEG